MKTTTRQPSSCDQHQVSRKSRDGSQHQDIMPERNNDFILERSGGDK